MMNAFYGATASQFYSGKRNKFDPCFERPFDCPLVAVPDHGRLIDADALIKEQEERYCKDCAKRKGTKKARSVLFMRLGMLRADHAE